MVSISPVPATAQLAGVIPLADRRPDSAAQSAAARPRRAPGELSLTLPAGSGYALEAGARRTTVRRTWLDTFDWRLYRAGLTLEQVTSRGTAELRLTGRDGTLLAAERLRPAAQGTRGGRVPRWPALLAAVPPGPLAEELAPVVGVRALLPVVRATSVLREQRALNSDDKTIARITADQMSVTAPEPAGAPRPAGPAAPGRAAGTPDRDRGARLPGPGRPAGEPAGRAAGRAAAGPPGAGGRAGRGRPPGQRLHRADRRRADGRHAGRGGHGRGHGGAAGHAAGQRARHRARHRHRVPARPAGGGAADQDGAQAGRQVLPGGARGRVPAGVQVAGRPDHADQGPRRLPARPARR